MTQPGVQPVYFRAFMFSVEIQGIQQAYFQEVSGIDSTVDVAELGVGGQLYNSKFPAKVKHSNLSLKRGYTIDSQLWVWFASIMTGDVEGARKDVSVLQLDMLGAETFRWNLFNAFPVKYTGASFNAKGSDLAIETLELAYERLERDPER